MDNTNWLITTILCEQMVRERLDDATRLERLHAVEDDVEDGGGVKRALASAIVRLGLRLDPAAGEGLGGQPLEHAVARR